MKRNRPTLRSRILLGMVTIGLLTTLVMALQGLHCSWSGVQRMERRYLAHLLDLHTARLNEWIDERGRDLVVLARLPAVTAALSQATDTPAAAIDAMWARQRERASAALADLLDASPGVRSISLFRADLTPVARLPGRGAKGAIAAATPAFCRSLAEADAIIWRRHAAAKAGRAELTMGLAVRDRRSHQVLGYLVARLRLPTRLLLPASPTLGTTHDDATRIFLVAAADGRFLNAANQAGTWFGELCCGAPPDMLAGDGGRLFSYSEHTGRHVLGMARPFGGTGWVLVAETHREDAFAVIRFLAFRAGVTAALAVLVMCIVALRASTALSRPLRELERVSRHVSAGGMEARVGDFSGREASEVAAAFNAMLDKLAVTQRQLAQAASLAAIGELSASIVHEMRNPLNTIQMNLAALRRRVTGDEQHAELLQLAERQSERLQRMLNDLLGYGRPLTLRSERVDMAELAAELLEAHGGTAMAAGVTPFLENAAPGPIIVAGDREQLQRALGNLVDNAVKASPTGGRVTIRLDASAEGCTVQIVDAGAGVPEAMREKLFRPFFTTRIDGTGLGLAICRKIVDLHGGRVIVSDADGGGACFTVHLPLFRESEA